MHYALLQSAWSDLKTVLKKKRKKRKKEKQTIIVKLAFSWVLWVFLGNYPTWEGMVCRKSCIWSPQVACQLLAAAAKSLQSCPTLCDPREGSPLGSPVPGILRAWTLEWVDISFYNARKWKVKVKSLSCVRLLVTPWTTAYQASPSMGFARQEYWCGLPLPSLCQLLRNFIFCWHLKLRQSCGMEYLTDHACTNSGSLVSEWSWIVKQSAGVGKLEDWSLLNWYIWIVWGEKMQKGTRSLTWFYQRAMTWLEFWFCLWKFVSLCKSLNFLELLFPNHKTKIPIRRLLKRLN